jgi:ATP-dependent Clp protease ATP-binding subunit ClpA
MVSLFDANPGQAATKSEAVAEAERAIDRALARKKLRLVGLTTSVEIKKPG